MVFLLGNASLLPAILSHQPVQFLGTIILKSYYTDSEGRTVENLRLYRKAEKKLKRLHHQLSRKQKQSSNRKKARKTLAKGYLKVQRQREDFARKQANALVTSHDLIAFEDLKIANMVRNPHLAKSINDAAWSQFLTWVCAYGVMHAIPIVKVAPNYTSQDCSACGTRIKKSLSVRTHICTSCGVVLDRDPNYNLLRCSDEEKTNCGPIMHSVPVKM
jgi:putative transposase